MLGISIILINYISKGSNFAGVLITRSNGEITANFESSTVVKVSAANFILSISFVGNSDLLRNYTSGLLGIDFFFILVTFQRLLYKRNVAVSTDVNFL